MSAPGLDKRLNQHARRAGLMVGLSMALTIALCIGSFVWIYAKVDPLARDFVDQSTVPPTRPAAASTGDEDDADNAADNANTNDDDNSGEIEEPDPTEEPEPTATSRAFDPTHRMIAQVPVNLRPGPGVNSGDPITTIPPGAELQYLNNSDTGPDSSGEELNWLEFRTEDGEEGWIREVDVEPINPGQ
jgi:hypothetical protein